MQKTLTNCTGSSKTCSLEVHRKTELAPVSPRSRTRSPRGAAPPAWQAARGHGGSRGWSRARARARAHGSASLSRGRRGASTERPWRARLLACGPNPAAWCGRPTARRRPVPTAGGSPPPSSAPRG